MVGGVTPGKGGQTALEGKVPVFDSCAEAREQIGANVSLILFRPRLRRMPSWKRRSGNRVNRLHYGRHSGGADG